MQSDYVSSVEIDRRPREVPDAYEQGSGLCGVVRPSSRSARYTRNQRLESPHLPMLRHIPQPLHAGGLEADAGVEAAGDGAVDDGLLLLLQQLDQLLLGADVAPDPPVRVVKKADNGGLFGERWDDCRNGTKVRCV